MPVIGGIDFGSDLVAPIVVAMVVSLAGSMVAVASRWMWKRQHGKGPWVLTATDSWYRYQLRNWLFTAAREVIVETTDTGEKLGSWPEIGLGGSVIVAIGELDPMPSVRWRGLIRSHGPVQLARPSPTAEPPPGTSFKDRWLAAPKLPLR